MTSLSKTQIDKLGDRLRNGEATSEDLLTLDMYRRGFEPVYAVALKKLRENFRDEVSGRSAKTTESIIRKLRRGKTRHVRLSQMQDICGLRIVVPDIEAQNETVRKLESLFPEAEVEDRRGNPSHGYRAVHVIAVVSGLQVEIQVRTVLQHMWAQFCEYLADKLGIGIKYGENEGVQKLLGTFSEAVRHLEEVESGLIRENPCADPVAREYFIESFRSLVRFVEQGPGQAGKGSDVLLH